MATEAPVKHRHLKQRVRLLALFLQLVTFYAAYVVATGTWEITSGGEALWILAGVSWGVLSLIAAPWYRPPRDAFAVALTTLATLVPIDPNTAPHLPSQVALLRESAIFFCIALLLAASLAMAIEHGGKWENARKLIHSLVDRFSGGPLVFGTIALISIFGYYDSESTRLWLIVLWFGFALARPYEWLLLLILRLRGIRSTEVIELAGRVRRVDHPDIVRFALEPGALWDSKAAYIAALPGGRSHYLLPIGLQVQNDELIATALCCGIPASIPTDLEPGSVMLVSDLSERQALVNKACRTTDDMFPVSTNGTDLML